MRCWGFATALLSDIRQLVARPCPLSSRKRIVCVVAAAAWLHFHCKRGLLVFHKYPLRHLGFSAERQLKTRTNTDGREARDRCFQQGSRLCPEAQILSLTRLCFRIAPPNILPTRSFPLYQRQALNWCFVLCWAQGGFLSCTPKKQSRMELSPEGAGAVPVGTRAGPGVMGGYREGPHCPRGTSGFVLPFSLLPVLAPAQPVQSDEQGWSCSAESLGRQQGRDGALGSCHG